MCFNGLIGNSEVSAQNAKYILFAVLVILLMCWFHCKSDVIVSPKYFAESVSDKF